jgi:septal ring factor EnvC (AmiA/AmiB activator)
MSWNLQRVMKEKNMLAERLKNAESARKRFDEDIKRYANESVTREEIRQSLENEVRRLTQTVGQTEGGLREKEEQVMRCEAYIDGMEAKQHACQVPPLSLLIVFSVLEANATPAMHVVKWVNHHCKPFLLGR